MEGSRVCSEVCEEEDWHELTTQKGPPFGVCQLRNHEKQRPPKQAATNQSTVLGEDQLCVLDYPGFIEFPGRIWELIGSRPWAALQLPLRQSHWAALFKSQLFWMSSPGNGWKISDIAGIGGFRPLQSEGILGAGLRALLHCHCSFSSHLSSFNKVFPELQKKKINWGIRRTHITEKLFFCHLFLSLLIAWLV